jgi:hypothetical protein
MYIIYSLQNFQFEIFLEKIKYGLLLKLYKYLYDIINIYKSFIAHKLQLINYDTS